MQTVATLPFRWGSSALVVLNIKILNLEEQQALLEEMGIEFTKVGSFSTDDFEVFLLKNCVIDREALVSQLKLDPDTLHLEIGELRKAILGEVLAVNKLLSPERVKIGVDNQAFRLYTEEFENFSNLPSLSSVLVYSNDVEYRTVMLPDVNSIAAIKVSSLEELLENVKPSFVLCQLQDYVYKTALAAALVYNYTDVLHNVCYSDLNKDVSVEWVADILYDAIIKINSQLEYEKIDWEFVQKNINTKFPKNSGNFNPFSKNNSEKSKDKFGNFSKNSDQNSDFPKNSKNSILESSKKIRKENEEKTKLNKSKNFCFKNIKKERVKSLYDELGRFIFGQDEAIDELSRAVKRSRVGIKDVNRPAGSFIFAGQTGVGKTYCAKMLAKSLGKEVGFIKINCSELALSHEAVKLIGAPPSYIGHESGGLLTNYIANHPTSVVVFDEFEKAHDRVQELLLQVLEDGELCDGKNTMVSFKDCIIILTTNLGAQEIKVAERCIGFGNKECDNTKQKQIVVESIEKKYKPEFVNRLDQIIYFNALTEESYRQIIQYYLVELKKTVLINNDTRLIVKEGVYDYVYNNSIDDRYGARPIRRFIEQKVHDKIADKLIDLDETNITLIVSIVNDEISVEQQKQQEYGVINAY